MSARFDQSINIFQRTDEKLDNFFYPQNVAVIGASEKPKSVGRTLLWNLISSPFGGTVYPVNDKRKSVLGIKSYPSIADVPAKVDLAIIATPAKTVPDIVSQCVKAKVGSAIIISAGFKEMGEEGLKLEMEIEQIIKKKQMRIIGPNCLGIMNPANGLNATFAADMALKGSVAFISQSGALCTAILDWSLKEKVGFSSFVSIGSMMDIKWSDLINYFGNDPNTASILIYMENLSNPRAFLSAAREVALTKPIILIKAGKTEESAKAAISHTGAMAGSNDVLNAALKRVGVLRVDSISDLFSMAEILAKQPLPKGPKLSIITNAGGPGVLATDALIENGGKLAQISESAMKKLNEFLPLEWSHNNPIDILGDASDELYGKTLDVVSKDPSSDGILVILTPQNMTDPTAVAYKLKEFSALKKPILASWMGAERVKEGRVILSGGNIPIFEYPDDACKAFSYMWQYSHNLSSIYETPALQTLEVEEDLLQKRHKKIVKCFDDVLKQKRVVLTEYESKSVLEAYNIPTITTYVAKNLDEAIKYSEKIGYPVVLKIYSTTITHKKNVGGVKLNLSSKEAVKKAYEEIYEAIKTLGIEHFEGVTVQKMAKLDGFEIILGASYDSVFGPVLLFGAGGSLVEIFNDKAIGLPPLNSTLASQIMEQTKIYKALKNNKKIDLDLLKSIFVQLSNLIAEYPMIKECDINPLLVSNEKIIALDARIILHSDEKHSQLAIRPYPLQYVSIAKLKDGTSAIIRPIRPEDEHYMITFLNELSDKNALNRYLKEMNYNEFLAKESLTRICCNDYDREIAVVVEKKENKKSEILAIGRLTKINDHEAFFALIVKDKWQNKSIGSELLKKLVQIAKGEKLSLLKASLLKENIAMQTICKKVGFRLTEEDGKLLAQIKLKK